MMYRSARHGCLRLFLRRRIDAHLTFFPARLVADHTVDQGVNGIVASQTNVAPGMDPGAALADQDIAGPDLLAGVNLDSPPLAWAVPAVARRALSFLMRHGAFSSVKAVLSPPVQKQFGPARFRPVCQPDSTQPLGSAPQMAPAGPVRSPLGRS